jgi:hypothetical protein
VAHLCPEGRDGAFDAILRRVHVALRFDSKGLEGVSTQGFEGSFKCNSDFNSPL